MMMRSFSFERRRKQIRWLYVGATHDSHHLKAYGRKIVTNFYNCVVELLAFTARGAIMVVHPEYWAVSIKPKQQPILVSNHGGHGAETSPEKGDVAKV